MRYFGGKTQTCKDITFFLKSIRLPNQVFMSPFIGGGWVECLMEYPKICSDKHRYLMAMYIKLQQGWDPPKKITKKEYLYIKDHQDEKPYLTGFVGFGCSFAGKWFGGYANDKKGEEEMVCTHVMDTQYKYQNRNFCKNARRSILEKMNGLYRATFECCDYKDLNPKDMLIYCDPPYCGTAPYSKDIVGEFDHNVFWDTMRQWGKFNTVIISEYKAPDDFFCVKSIKLKTDMNSASNDKIERVEKLFSPNNIEDIKKSIGLKNTLFE